MNDSYVNPEVVSIWKKTLKKFKVKSLTDLKDNEKDNALTYMNTLAKKAK